MEECEIFYKPGCKRKCCYFCENKDKCCKSSKCFNDAKKCNQLKTNAKGDKKNGN